MIKAIFYPTAEVVRAGKNKPAQAQMSCIVALNKEMTTHFGSRRCALSLFQTAPLIETRVEIILKWRPDVPALGSAAGTGKTSSKELT